ncbi:CLUMA_CG012568, isoform A [Clunio marinus]|uniref:CLUMA_CG012568, isoform A n=1 Tax=Clunio marinus TaxID=568069 RepID=A0A1J1IGM3_9DIPT|nr:CLUMA_CG012568, isoform A [Clunio marinus]
MSEVAIKVVVRVRPFNRREMEQNQKNIIRVLDESTLVFDPDEDEDEFFFHGAKQTHRDITKRIKKKLNMEFDSVFDDKKCNEEVFEICTKPIVTSVMNGFNCSVFVYGATGAGKTYTMLGSENNPGITFLTMRELFSQIQKLECERRFEIGISYLEVYNEQVMNLLTKSGPLKLREDSNGVVVGGLVLKQIRNAEELFELLIIGNKNRTQHPTDANEESSRSHAIFQVHIRMTDNKTSVRRTVKLSMIDLAGSERAQSTKCKGLRFKEGANINKSLLALGNCINKLADGCKHIPYRDSNLTRILKDSLGGNCQTLMIANISPSSLTYEDTYNTLKYASRAKKIRTNIRQNTITTNIPKEFLLKRCDAQVTEIEKLKSEIEEIKAENEKMKRNMLEANGNEKQATNNKMNGSGDALLQEEIDLTAWMKKIDEIYNHFKKTRERCLSLQSVEKVLNFRIKFAERYEEVKKILTLDGSKLENDLSRLGASIDKYNKEVSRIRHEDSSIWSLRFKEANRSLENLKLEVNNLISNQSLGFYLKAKETELENSKLQLKVSHVNKMNSIYQLEMENWNKVVFQAAEIIQENFLLLRSMGELDNAMLERLQAVGKLLQGQRSVKFSDDEAMNSTNQESTETNLLLLNSHITYLADLDYVANSPMSGKKRGHEDFEKECATKKVKSSEDFVFIKPKALKSINFDSTSLLKAEVADKRDLNTTFDLETPKTGTIVLTDKSNKPISSSSSFAASAMSKVKSKYALNIHKENKKFSPGSSRVKKLARTPIRSVSGTKEHRPKLVKSAVASSLVVPGKDKFKSLKKKL